MKRILLLALCACTLIGNVKAGATVNVSDVLNLTGIGGPNIGGGPSTPLSFTNYGGGNQHTGALGPVYLFFGDFPVIKFQRTGFDSRVGSYSYLVLYKGAVLKNTDPPSDPSVSLIIPGSSTQGLPLPSPSNPPDFTLDVGAISNDISGDAARQVHTFMLRDPLSIYTIAIVEKVPHGNGNNVSTTIQASFQFNFPVKLDVNGKPIITVNTQLGFLTP